ncbi:hypothetical protein FHG87_014490 [Trinorchestia longiramus]|nr:hypothetical protein FHG87_014490 [Trinorchestia longiramus]
MTESEQRSSQEASCTLLVTMNCSCRVIVSAGTVNTFKNRLDKLWERNSPQFCNVPIPCQSYIWPASFDALRDWCSDDESLHQQELLTLHPVSPSVPPRPRIFLAATAPPPLPSSSEDPTSSNSDQPAPDNEINSAPADTTDHPEHLQATARPDDQRTTPVLRRKLPRPEQLCLALSNKYPPSVVPIDVSGNSYRRMQKQRSTLVEVEFVRTRVGSSRRRRRKHVRRRNTISDTREVAGLVGHSSKDNQPGRVVRCTSLTSKARKSTRLNLTAQPQPSTSSGRGASSSPSEGCYSTDGPSFDPSFDASEASDYCSFVCRRLPKPTQSRVSFPSFRIPHTFLPQILGVAVALPTPPQHVLTPHRRLPQRANTFRDDVNDDEGIAAATSHTSPDTAVNYAPSCSHSSDRNQEQSTASDQRSSSVSAVQGPSRLGSADLQRLKLRDEDRVLREEGARSSSGNWSASSSARTSLDLDVQNRNICEDLVNQSLQQTFDETADWSYRNFESDCLDTDELDSLGISLIAGKNRRIYEDDVARSANDDNGNSLIPSNLAIYERNDNSKHSTVSERTETSSHHRLKEDLKSASRKFDEPADSTKPDYQNSSDSPSNSSSSSSSSSSSDSSAPRNTSAAAVRAQGQVGDGGNTSRSLTPSGNESPASVQPSESTAPQSSPSSAQRTQSCTTDDLPSSSSFTSDGTLTPTQDIQDIPFFDDDTSSAYSCDTEGYYTSFHIDSGLRSTCSYEDTKLATSASDSETPGGGGSRSASGSIAGSISNSSAASLGTVIMRNPEKKTPPKPPQRVSSLDRKSSSASNRESIITVIHVNGSAGSSREDLVASSGSETADSGRETSSSATEPTSPRQTTASCVDVAAAELERKDSFRSKTAINASGIPSMCVITPPISDDESVRSASGSKNSGNSSGGDDPALGSVAAKAMLFQGGSVGAGCGSVRQVPRIETSKTPPKSEPQQTPPTGSQASSQNKGPVKTLFHSTSVDYSVNVRPSAIKQSDLTRRLSGDGHVSVTSASNTSLSQKEVTAAQTACVAPPPVAPPPRIHKVPPPPPPREDSIDSSTSRKVEAYKPSVGDASATAPTASPRYTLQHQQQQIQLQQQLPPQMQIPNAAGVEEVQPFSAVPPSVKQNLVITPTNSLERKRLKATAGAHVTLDSEGKVVYSSDSLPRSQKSVAANDSRPGNGSLHSTGPSIASGGTLPPGISSIQQMPLPPPPVESAPAIPELPVQVTNAVNSSAAALQQHQQHIQQQLMQQQQQQQQQQHQQLLQQQQQQQMMRQDQEEKLQRHRQEELLLQRAVQQQIDQSKQEVLQQQSALKQQHQELQQQLHETRLELQRQQQEQQQKLQALRERQAYLQSKTLPKNSSSTSGDKKQSKQGQKEQNSKEAKLKQEQQQQRLLQQQQQTQQQLVIEQQKQLQLAEQQKQLQLQKQQQQQQLQYQQQQIIQQQQQYQLQQQQHVPPPPPADPRQPPEGMGSSSGATGGVILPSTGAPMSPRSQRAGAYVHVQASEQMSAIQQQQFQQQQQQPSQVSHNSQYPSRPHSAQGLYSASLAQQQQQQQQQQTSSTPGPTSRAPTPIQGVVTSSPRHSPFTAASTPQQLQQQQQLALQQPGQQQLQATPGTSVPHPSIPSVVSSNSNESTMIVSASFNSSSSNIDRSSHDWPKISIKNRDSRSASLDRRGVDAGNPKVNGVDCDETNKNLCSNSESFVKSANSNSLDICPEKGSNRSSKNPVRPSTPKNKTPKSHKSAIESSKQMDKSKVVDKSSSGNESFLSNIIKLSRSPMLHKRANRSENKSPTVDKHNVTKDSDDSLNISIGSESYKAGTCVDDIPNTPLSSSDVEAPVDKVPMPASLPLTTDKVFAALAHARRTSNTLNCNSVQITDNALAHSSNLACREGSDYGISSHNQNPVLAGDAHLRSKLDHCIGQYVDDVKDLPSYFQRNNSYRLATVAEQGSSAAVGSNSRPVSSNLTLGRVSDQQKALRSVTSFNRPMINNIPLHGPRVIVQNESKALPVRPFNRHDGMYNSIKRNKNNRNRVISRVLSSPPRCSKSGSPILSSRVDNFPPNSSTSALQLSLLNGNSSYNSLQSLDVLPVGSNQYRTPSAQNQNGLLSLEALRSDLTHKLDQKKSNGSVLVDTPAKCRNGVNLKSRNGGFDTKPRVVATIPKTRAGIEGETEIW